MSRRDDKMSNADKIDLGLLMASPSAGRAMGALVATPAHMALGKHGTFEDDKHLKEFILKEGLRGEVGKDVTVKRGEHPYDYRVNKSPKGEFTVHTGPDPIGAMHELGHTKATNPLSSLRHWNVRKSNELTAETEKLIMNAKGYGIGEVMKGMAKQVPHHHLEQALAPIDETLAWMHALKMPAAAGRRAKMVKTMIPALGGYLTSSAIGLGGLGLVGAGLYGAFHKKENE